MRLTVRPTKQFFIPKDEDKAYINIEALSLQEISKIESKCVITRVDETETASVTLDTHKRTDSIAKACLKGWGHLLDVDGSELKFNQHNLSKAAQYSIQMDDKLVRFYEWVESCHASLQEEIEEQGEAAAKN